MKDQQPTSSRGAIPEIVGCFVVVPSSEAKADTVERNETMNSKRVLQQAVSLVIVVLFMTGCGGTLSEPTPTSTPVPPTPTPVLDGLVDVGGYKLNIHCEGEGSPTVIFDSSMGTTGDDWSIIQSHIEELTRACYYDRVGLGKSDPCPKASYTTQDMVDDLHKLLINANIAGPYVYVAHSLAGLNARLYASQYPQDVVGMVLINVSHPDQMERLLALYPPESPDESAYVRMGRQFFSGGYIDDFMEGPEYLDWDTSAAQVRATGTLGSIPLVVLSADQGEPPASFPPELAESLYQEDVQMCKELAALSSNGTHIIVEDSDHAIHWEHWELVVDTISNVVMEARGE
jgi:pimeloyl-ACP methyl ester carboxylesterase